MSLSPSQAAALAKWSVKTVELVVCKRWLSEQVHHVAELISSQGVGARYPTDYHWNTELLLYYGTEIQRLDQELSLLADSVHASCT